MDRANSEEMLGDLRQARRLPQRRHNKFSSRGKPDGHQDFQVRQGVAGEQDRQINREGLHKRHYEQGDRDEFNHLADGQPIKEGCELHDQDVQERVSDGQRDFIAPLVPPILHRVPSRLFYSVFQRSGDRFASRKCVKSRF